MRKILWLALAVTALLCAACENAAAPSGMASMGLDDVTALLAALTANTVAEPHEVSLTGIDFTDGTGVMFGLLCAAIGESGKYIALDLSACTGTSFAPAPGKEFIVSLILPEGEAAVPAGAFRGFPVLKRAYLPASLVSLGEGAFADCPELETVSFPASTESVHPQTFTGSPRVVFDVRGRGLLASPAYPASGSLAIPTGRLLVRNGVTLMLAAPSYDGTTPLPAAIQALGAKCFYANTNITHITIPDGVTAIGDNAFWGCTNLVSVTVPPPLPVSGGLRLPIAMRLRLLRFPRRWTWRTWPFTARAFFP